MYRNSTRHTWISALGIVLGLAPSTAAANQPKEDRSELARRAQAVLTTHCHKCHGKDGAAEGGFNYVLDLGKLVAHRKVSPGNAEQSPLFRRISSGKMPPPTEPNRPSEEEIATLKQWIDAGAPAAGAAVARTFISESDLVDLMLTDLEKLDRRGRRFVRYGIPRLPTPNQSTGTACCFA
jgi:mono/diheme cytochrome c family protein